MDYVHVVPPYLDYPYWRSPESDNYDALLCDLAILSYAGPQFIQSKLMSAPFTLLTDCIIYNDIQCIVVRNKKGDVIVTFRGTTSLHDWYEDFDFEINNEGIHSGFYNSFMPFLEKLNFWVKRMNVIFVGHSLGAALVTVAVDKLTFKNASLITFGSPRVGTPEFAERVYKKANKIKRYVHGKDVVPDVPFRDMRFEHVGRMIHIEQISRPWLNIFCPRRIYDHVPTNYSNILWKSLYF